MMDLEKLNVDNFKSYQNFIADWEANVPMGVWGWDADSTKTHEVCGEFPDDNPCVVRGEN